MNRPIFRSKESQSEEPISHVQRWERPRAMNNLTMMVRVPKRIHSERWKYFVCSDLSIEWVDENIRRRFVFVCRCSLPFECVHLRTRRDIDNRWYELVRYQMNIDFLTRWSTRIWKDKIVQLKCSLLFNVRFLDWYKPNRDVCDFCIVVEDKCENDHRLNHDWNLGTRERVGEMTIWTTKATYRVQQRLWFVLRSVQSNYEQTRRSEMRFRYERIARDIRWCHVENVLSSMDDW